MDLLEDESLLTSSISLVYEVSVLQKSLGLCTFFIHFQSLPVHTHVVLDRSYLTFVFLILILESFISKCLLHLLHQYQSLHLLLLLPQVVSLLFYFLLVLHFMILASCLLKISPAEETKPSAAAPKPSAPPAIVGEKVSPAAGSFFSSALSLIFALSLLFLVQINYVLVSRLGF